MKKLSIGFALVLALAGQASATGIWFWPHSNVETLLQVQDENTIPWPWGYEAPFPWSFVQGVWLAEHGDFRSFFSFRVVSDKSGLQQLEVSQVDPESCEPLARGVGFEQNKIVRAQMTTADGTPYRVALRAFPEQMVNAVVGHKPIHEQYVVLSVYPFDQTKAVHMPITQVTVGLVNFQCRVLR